ncbi:MAG: hypothetical protein LBS79_03720, partial [Tannerella sp.]|nr:hypothetical protein [Tannerella sp.]
GKIFIDRNNKYLIEMAEGIEKITYGNMRDETAWETEAEDNGDRQYPSVMGEIIHNRPVLSFRWQQQNPSGDPAGFHPVKTHLAGDYNLYNVLAAVAAGLHFGIPPEQINDAISSYEPANNRSQLKKTADNTLIIDAYNANPSSMRAALENFTSFRNSPPDAPSRAKNRTPRPKAVILGDMLELGRKSRELHEEILSLADGCGFDKILLCGERFSAAGQQYTCFKTVDELNEYLKANPLKGYEILIKGSHGIHLEKIIGNL